MILVLLQYFLSTRKHSREEFTLTSSANSSGYGSVNLDWSSHSATGVIYKVFRSKGDNDKFELVPRDYTQVTHVRCLQVYPHDHAANQLQTWMDEYGNGIINVTAVSFDDFNQNPKSYLLNQTTQEWSYDVVFLGTWDGNNGKDLSNSAVEPLQNFINSGRGVIFGHDTFSLSSVPRSNHANINKFAPLLDITLQEIRQIGNGEMVFVAKIGLLTSYPWTHNRIKY